jgi:hypothetical protein
VKLALLRLTVSVLLLPLTLSLVLAKNTTVGIYAIVDHVMFEPNDCVRISGIFVVPVRMSSGDYQKPQRGYLYLTIEPGAEKAIRREWNDLKAIAGSGNVVAFGQYWVPNPYDPQGNPHHPLEVTVHQESEIGATPDVYPIPLPGGIKRAEALAHDEDRDPDADKITVQLQEAWRR